ncbi:histidine decarboxylase [Protopterus annectens]|uniref:histidine decarboxylase n=1 Tax=Protopterus annectens TaxID=7888 RepID=UPI001CFA88A2|nr:histidine decarboxylase [Protopterus annectens]
MEASSPACTELEMNVMDWLAKLLGLPPHFLHYHPDSSGGGVLQSTVSESTLISLLAARKEKILEMKKLEPDTEESVLNSRFIAYTSDQAHSSVEKAGLIALVKMRFLATDENFSLRGETLKKAIEEDRKEGCVPIFLCATLGTTGVCAFDHLEELGLVCMKEGLWLHIDAAYAGTAFVCPEFRGFLKGIEYADSFTFNPSKWMMVHFDCTAFWVRDKYKLQQTFNVSPMYLKHANSGATTDFMHWQIPLSRRFRSLKLWFVLRSFGIRQLQEHVRHGTKMAKLFESLVQSDPRFEIPAKRHLGLVVFNLQGPNILTECLLRELMQSGSMYLVPATIQDRFIIRFTVTSQFTTKEDVLRDWNIIQQTARKIISKYSNCQPMINIDWFKTNPENDKNSRLSDIQVAQNQVVKQRAEEVDSSIKQQVNKEQRNHENLVTSDNEECMSASEETFAGDSQTVIKCKPSSFMFSSCLAVQSTKKAARCHSCNSVPMNSLREFSCQNILPNDSSTIMNPQVSDNMLSKLPEKVMILEKSAFKKLTKFYSVPSFPECSIHCGVQLPCCPLQAFS